MEGYFVFTSRILDEAELIEYGLWMKRKFAGEDEYSERAGDPRSVHEALDGWDVDERYVYPSWLPHCARDGVCCALRKAG